MGSQGLNPLHVAVFIFISCSQLAWEKWSRAVHPCWCVLVSRCLRAEWAVSPAKWLSVVGLSRKIVAILCRLGEQLLSRLSWWNQMGNCWSWVRVEPRDSHESVSLVWGWVGGRSEKQMRHSFRPKSYHDYALEDHAVKWYNWYHVEIVLLMPSKEIKLADFNKEHHRLAACTVFDLWWTMFNDIQCVFLFYGQFENMSQTHVERRIRCSNLKLMFASSGAVKPCWGWILVDFVLILLMKFIHTVWMFKLFILSELDFSQVRDAV